MVSWLLLPTDLSQPGIDTLAYGVLVCEALHNEADEITDFVIDRFNNVASRELPALATWIAGATLTQLFPEDVERGLLTTYKEVCQNQVSSRGIYRSPTTGLWYQSVIMSWQNGVVVMGKQVSLAERTLALLDSDQAVTHHLQQSLIHHKIRLRVMCYPQAEQFWKAIEAGRFHPNLLLVDAALAEPGYLNFLAHWQLRSNQRLTSCPLIVWGHGLSLAEKKRCYLAGAILTLDKANYTVETLFELVLGSESAS